MEKKMADKSVLDNQRIKSRRLRPETAESCLGWPEKKMKEGTVG